MMKQIFINLKLTLAVYVGAVIVLCVLTFAAKIAVQAMLFVWSLW